MVLHRLKRTYCLAVRRRIKRCTPCTTVRWSKLVALRIKASGERSDIKPAASIVKRALCLARTRAVPQATPRLCDRDTQTRASAVVKGQVEAAVTKCCSASVAGADDACKVAAETRRATSTYRKSAFSAVYRTTSASGLWPTGDRSAATQVSNRQIVRTQPFCRGAAHTSWSWSCDDGRILLCCTGSGTESECERALLRRPDFVRANVELEPVAVESTRVGPN